MQVSSLEDSGRLPSLDEDLEKMSVSSLWSKTMPRPWKT